MRSLINLLLAFVLLTSTSYAFSNPRFTSKSDSSVLTDRQVSGFTKLKIEGPFHVYITQGTVESVKLDAPAEILDRIITEVDGGVLKIHNKHDNWSSGSKSWWSDKSWWHTHKKINVYITVKELNSISTSGSNQVFFKDGIITDNLELRVRGSGNMLGKIEVKTLKSSISGSGNITLSGNAGSSTVRLTGSSNFNARDLTTINSAVHVSGSGNAEINASDKVAASISGSGGVRYAGDAKIINRKTSGSGSISRF